jgi:hypothetical protein
VQFPGGQIQTQEAFGYRELGSGLLILTKRPSFLTRSKGLGEVAVFLSPTEANEGNNDSSARNVYCYGANHSERPLLLSFAPPRPEPARSSRLLFLHFVCGNRADLRGNQFNFWEVTPEPAGIARQYPKLTHSRMRSNVKIRQG